MNSQRNYLNVDGAAEICQVRRRFWPSAEVEESLLSYDVECVIAHVRMLAETGIVDQQSAKTVLEGLQQMQLVVEAGGSYVAPGDVDIHSAMERRLKEIVGDAGGLISIAKSRNDQIATVVRMWLRDEVAELFATLVSLRRDLVGMAERDLDVLMPGYTHMQPAQPILLSHWWLANEARFKRDCERLRDFYGRLNVLPLGACVLAGTTEPIDRKLVAQYLAFDDVVENSLDAVSDRDFIIEFAAFASLFGVHVSQMSSDLLLWCTQEFGFVRLQNKYVLRSERLPYKKNPELLEVLRARPSVFYGRLIEAITTMKALPSGFSQDLQESIPGLFDTVENLRFLLDLTATILEGIEFDGKRMREMACSDLANWRNAARYLVDHGLDHERAEKVMESLSAYCKARNKSYSDLSLSEWQQFSPAFESDVYEFVTIEQSVGSICSFGGSSKEQVESAIERAKILLNEHERQSPKRKSVLRTNAQN